MWLLLLVTLAPAIWGQSTDLYRRTHDALVASFLPVAELHNDPALTELLTAAGEGIWANAGQLPQFRQMIAPFTNLRTLGSACGMDALVGEIGVTPFADL